MKNLMLVLLLASCSLTTGNNSITTEKMLSKHIPSALKTVKEGKAIASARLGRADTGTPPTTSTTPPATGDFSLLDRLYDTVWYQSELDYDDGKIEHETEFVIFNNNSYMVKREMENGVMEAVEADDYSQLTWIQDVALTALKETLTDKKSASRNAMIVVNTSLDDGKLEKEYEGYLLYVDPTATDKTTSKILYIVEAEYANQATAISELSTVLNAINDNPTLAQYIDSEKYVLSTVPLPTTPTSNESHDRD